MGKYLLLSIDGRSHFPVCCWIDWLLMIKNCLIESGPPCMLSNGLDLILCLQTAVHILPATAYCRITYCPFTEVSPILYLVEQLAIVTLTLHSLQRQGLHFWAAFKPTISVSYVADNFRPLIRLLKTFLSEGNSKTIPREVLIWFQSLYC
jgi:hypothetical protein